MSGAVIGFFDGPFQWLMALFQREFLCNGKSEVGELEKTVEVRLGQELPLWEVGRDDLIDYVEVSPNQDLEI